MTIDQIALIGNIFITYILGLVNYLFKNPAVRLVYGLSTGLVMCFFMYGSDVIHLLVDTLVTYLFLALFGRRRSPFWIVLFTLLHLSYLHISRMINDYGGWSLDVTTIYMMSICKFSSICWSYEDGGKSDDSFKSEVIRQK